MANEWQTVAILKGNERFSYLAAIELNTIDLT